jgi:hypothetical protein
MDDNPWRAPRLSPDAMRVMDLLLPRGGGMRVAPLLQAAGIPPDDLAAAINELLERSWIDVVWRGPEAHRPARLPERFRKARRIATTRTGRHCHPFLPRY